MNRKVRTADFLATQPVFSLVHATRALGTSGNAQTVERLKHYLKQRRLFLAARGVYAVVPHGAVANRFRPDPILVALAMRPDAIFSHHTALELLGAAHSVWRVCTLYTGSPRRALELDGTTVRFLDHPKPLRTKRLAHVATRRVEWRGQMVEVTGPERTLIEGFRRPGLAGGLEEFVLSASGFPTLDLRLVEDILRRYDTANLWAAAGWFLDRYRQVFHVPPDLLARMVRHRPRSPQYLERGTRGGVLAGQWNVIVPRVLAEPSEPDER
jgi:predicted transcriptional regulator of viral defense system